MGRLNKAKKDQIAKLRKQGYTQKEAAEKAGVHLRTVRKYDPLRERSVRAALGQVQELESVLVELAAEGLVLEESGGFRITTLGRRICVKLQELERRAILEFIADAGRRVMTDEIDAYLHEIEDELLDQALNKVKGR